MILTVLLQAGLAGLGLGKVGAAIGSAIIALAAAIGIGKIGKGAMDAIARQPESSDKIRTAMLIAAAMVEGVALFAIIICLLEVLL